MKHHFTENLITHAVGIDNHKYLHVAALTRIDGQVLQSFSFSNDPTEIKAAVKESLTTRKDAPFILEDSNGHGKFLKEELIRLGCIVYHYPAKYTKRNKKTNTKSDFEDAKQIAMNFMRDISKARQLTLFDNYYINLKKRVRDRRLNIKELISMKNQIHASLHQELGDKYKKIIGFKDIFCKASQAKLQLTYSQSQEIDHCLLASKLSKIRILEEENKLIEKWFTKHDRGEIEALTAISGVSTLRASELLAEIGDISRFKKESSLARYAGIAPVEYFSSGVVKHRLDTQNNRKLNSIVFGISVYQHPVITPNERRKKKRYIIRKIHKILNRLRNPILKRESDKRNIC